MDNDMIKRTLHGPLEITISCCVSKQERSVSLYQYNNLSSISLLTIRIFKNCSFSLLVPVTRILKKDFATSCSISIKLQMSTCFVTFQITIFKSVLLIFCSNDELQINNLA